MTRTDTASRVIPAPAGDVWAALLDEDALAEWLPPEGMSGWFEHFDPRPGGSYRLVLTYADSSGSPGKASADTDVVEVRFAEIVPGVRIVQAVEFVAADPAYAGTMTLTWQLAPAGTGTRVEVRADDVPAGISAADHAAGLASSLANLARHVERHGPAAPPGRRVRPAGTGRSERRT
ncbi:SRPBCC family protein [Kocuria sp. M1R5S2]|uniref:SRPBCC family protein n=1 Tax=Kocuria rhizosphaerae TaxID=3376285 RepID=UPI0037AF8371